MKFGPLRALNRLSFEVLEGEVFGIAGPNGAGKSTLLNVCSGFLKPTGGQVFFGGERIDGKAPHQLCRRGLVRTFQVPQVFGSMTVAGNLEIEVEDHFALRFGHHFGGSGDLFASEFG